MDKLIEALLSDIGNPITIALLLIVGIVFLIKFVWNNWDRIKSGAESLYQRRKKQEELLITVDDLIEKTRLISQEVYNSKKEQKDFYNDQLKYKQQSQDLRDRLEDKYDIAIDKSNQALDEIKKTLETIQLMQESQAKYEERDRERSIVVLRSSIWNLYNEFKTQGYTTQAGLEVFIESCDLYERDGGNGVVANKLKPEVLALEIKD